MFGSNYEALSLTASTSGNGLAAAPNLSTHFAGCPATDLRQPRIAAAASVAIHGLLVIALILVPAYAWPTAPPETKKSPIVTALVNPYPAILASHRQNPSAGARPKAVAAANPLLRDVAQTPPVRIEVGTFDGSFRDAAPIPAHAGSGKVVVGALDDGGNGDGPAAPAVTVGPVGALDSFGPAPNQPGPLVGPELLTVPTPVYSEEARRLNVTGEVVLVVKLAASGSIHFVRIVSGLGHGLDEAAVAAVNRGRCQPATRAGIPIDIYGTITVIFRLT